MVAECGCPPGLALPKNIQRPSIIKSGSSLCSKYRWVHQTGPKASILQHPKLFLGSARNHKCRADHQWFIFFALRYRLNPELHPKVRHPHSLTSCGRSASDFERFWAISGCMNWWEIFGSKQGDRHAEKYLESTAIKTQPSFSDFTGADSDW